MDGWNQMSTSGTTVWYSGLIRTKGIEDTWLGYSQLLLWSGIMLSFLVQFMQDWLADYEFMTVPVLYSGPVVRCLSLYLMAWNQS